MLQAGTRRRSSFLVVCLFALAILLLVVASAHAQTLLYTLDTPNPQPRAEFGVSAAIGDVNSDGKGDIAVGAQGEDIGWGTNQGRAYVFSGQDGSLLLSLDSPSLNWASHFGRALAVGDVNGDGKGDIAVGVPREDVGPSDGRVYVFSGADGSVLLTLDSPKPQGMVGFGDPLSMGDVNGDGKADIAVGLHNENVGDNHRQGRAYVFSGADGSLLLTLDTPNPHKDAHFGSSVALGEVNSDGKADIAVGAHYENVGAKSMQGRVYLFSGLDGSLLSTLDSPNPQAGGRFGHSVALGDVNDDGKADMAVGAYYEDVSGNADQGRAYVFSLAPAPVGGMVEIQVDGSGSAVDSAPDSSGGSSLGYYIALAALAAAAVVALTAGGWYVRRRWRA